MRLICPNCDAQYEVDISAIPEAGRDVQCSSCGHGWFQLREGEGGADLSEALYLSPAPAPALIQAEEEEDEAPAAAMRPIPPLRRSLDESVLAVLREEAERETAARRAEAETIEVQGDLGLPPPVSPMVGQATVQDPEFERELERYFEENPLPEAGATPDQTAASQGKRAAARRELLPDIEEINSTLRPTDLGAGMGRAETPAQARSGFRAGFVLPWALAALILGLYLFAPLIVDHFPAAAPAVQAYVAALDGAREWLDGMIRKATQLLEGLAGKA